MKNFQSGDYVQQGHYKSFQPNPIDRVWSLDSMELIQLLGRADRELGRLDMYSDYIPNIDLFISMHVLKEATQSSKIEGTQTNMAEALLNREDVAPENRDDWEEVQNYVAAIRDKLRSDRSCQAGLSRWLKEKLVATTHMFRKRGNNQLDIWFTNSFDNA